MHEAIRNFISDMIRDVIEESSSIINKGMFQNVDEIRSLDFPVISFSKKASKNNEVLRKFLLKKMYRHTIVNRMTTKAKRIVNDLFTAFAVDFSILPIEWRERVEVKNRNQKYRVISDYIAGMTDRYAIMEHKRIFDLHDGWSGTSLYEKRDR